MGLLKILFFTVVPAGALAVSTFRLGRQLPKAARLMGNYIGLSYAYFKVALKVLRPSHELGVEIVDLVRKTSQQTNALKRQLRSSMVTMQDDIKKQVGVDIFEDEANDKPKPKQHTISQKDMSGNAIMKEIWEERMKITRRRLAKKEQQKFFTEL